ncbi:hypothetical protein [Photobacterium kagoshimensis]|uniref:pilus assembly protein n=1 Tax=Photobacterium kagoshimensis TaxID=2910242 RepID=UPI003D0AEE03
MNAKKQKGAAAIYFVLIAVAILGMGALGVEGSRYITEKAHLGDVMEATAVAVSESDDIRDDNKFDKVQQAKAKEVAKAWVDYLVPDNTHSDFVIDRKKEEIIKKLPSGQEVKRTIHKYYINSTTEHDSWMAMANVPSFDEKQKVSNRATAARVRTDFEPVDVVFVSDFSGSMRGERIRNLRSAIKDVTEMIFEGTQELQKKYPGEISDSSFGFVPFSKRVVFKKGNDYFCSSMLLPPKLSIYARPRFQTNFSSLVAMSKKQRTKWYQLKGVGYSGNEQYVMEKYISWAKQGSRHIDFNYSSNNGGFKSKHIDYYRTATELQLDKNNIKLMTPMKMGQRNIRTDRYCSINSRTPAHHVIDRTVMSKESELKSFNDKIKPMRVGGGTDMYQALLAAPSQFYGATNKNRFIFVLSDGDENNDSFKYLVKNKLCNTIRQEMSTNANGESIRFEMFVIGLKFNNRAQAYKDCFGKHIYTVNDLKKLKDVILELLTNTTSYNVERS